jgi:hypothetical protein
MPLHPAATGAGARTAAGRGAPGRVAAIHAQTRRGLAFTVAFAAASVVTAVAGVGDGWWLPLHLFAVGALLSAISAVTQMFAVTWSAAPSPVPALAGTQRWSLAVGTVLLVVGHERAATAVFVLGGTTVVMSMLMLVGILLQVRRRAVTDRFVPAIDTYVAAAVAGAVGMSLGIVLGAGRAGERAAELRGAHLMLNVFGLVGLVIAGSLPWFAATQVRSKLSARATPAALRVTLVGLAAATGLAAFGEIADRSVLVAGGLAGYAVGLVAVAAMMPISSVARLRWAGPRIAQLLCGLAWWAAMAVALGVAAVRDTGERALLQALVIGGFAQVLVASLAYLGPVLRGGGHERLTAGFATTRSWVSLAAGNAAAVAALAGHQGVLAVALTVWLAEIGVRAGVLLAPTRTGGRARGPDRSTPKESS